MRGKDVFRLLGGASVVYAAMAACAAPRAVDELDLGALPSRSGETAETDGGDGWPRSGVGLVDAARQFIDALAAPVRDARAAAPSTVTVPCKESYVVGSGEDQTLVSFATATFEGRSPIALARASALISGSSIPGFTHTTATVSVKQDTVAVACRGGAQVTFILPND